MIVAGLWSWRTKQLTKVVSIHHSSCPRWDCHWGCLQGATWICPTRVWMDCRWMQWDCGLIGGLLLCCPMAAEIEPQLQPPQEKEVATECAKYFAVAATCAGTSFAASETSALPTAAVRCVPKHCWQRGKEPTTRTLRRTRATTMPTATIHAEVGELDCALTELHWNCSVLWLPVLPPWTCSCLARRDKRKSRDRDHSRRDRRQRRCPCGGALILVVLAVWPPYRELVYGWECPCTTSCGWSVRPVWRRCPRTCRTNSWTCFSTHGDAVGSWAARRLARHDADGTFSSTRPTSDSVRTVVGGWGRSSCPTGWLLQCTNKQMNEWLEQHSTTTYEPYSKWLLIKLFI